MCECVIDPDRRPNVCPDSVACIRLFLRRPLQQVIGKVRSQEMRLLFKGGFYSRAAFVHDFTVCIYSYT